MRPNDPIEPHVDEVRPAARDERSTTSLLSEAMTHVSNLVRKEMDLARAEVSQSLNRAGVALGLLAGAVVLLITALNVLSAALVAGITELGVPGGWSAVIVGVVYLQIAYLMVRKGTNDLKASNFAPRRTTENVKKDAATVKGAFK